MLNIDQKVAFFAQKYGKEHFETSKQRTLKNVPKPLAEMPEIYPLDTSWIEERRHLIEAGAFVHDEQMEAETREKNKGWVWKYRLDISKIENYDDIPPSQRYEPKYFFKALLGILEAGGSADLRKTSEELARKIYITTELNLTCDYKDLDEGPVDGSEYCTKNMYRKSAQIFIDFYDKHRSELIES